jgi:hypothetical protein
MRPSFLSHIINGLLSFIALILYLSNYEKINVENTLFIILLLSIAFGIHGILHHYEELYYDFNPLENKWIPQSKAQANK